MPSPFPGMDPYLEHPHIWDDFYKSFFPTLRAALVPQVRPLGCVTRIDHRIDTVRYPYLEVIDRKRDEVVTLIELLSPSNKEPGNDRIAFLEKRRAVLAASASYVEIDLLRGHPRLPLRKVPACDYYVMASRPEDRPKVRVWPFGVRDRLPVVLVPLRAGEPEPAAHLRAVLDRVYDDAGDEDDAYRQAPAPPLPTADAAWARGVRTAAGVTRAG